ncbi:MAG: Coenzyme F420 hydrogenase/dehydrogenase, beta subunit C-terminal domain [Alphaproteobacteria bacterium]
MSEAVDIQKVVAGEYCSGCGACAAGGSGIKMRMTDDGRYEARLDNVPEAVLKEASERCPFAAKKNEDDLATDLFAKHAQKDDKIGYYISCYAGNVLEGDYRTRGSSGGFGSWIIDQLFEKDKIDAVIHVKETKESNSPHPMFSFAISEKENAHEGAKSRYYPIEMSQVLDMVLKEDRRYALVGIPCFIKAARLMQKQYPEMEKRIVFTLGLVCGHLKTSQFAEYYARIAHSDPKTLKDINFRHKLAGQPASRYGVKLQTGDNGDKILENRFISGSNWGYGLFKYNACDYCDDVVSETADLTIGDAWIPPYLGDWEGTNVLVVRNPIVEGILKEGKDRGAIELDPLTPQDVAKSQEPGFRHRREGLAFRLHLKEIQNLWHPRKRVNAVTPDQVSERTVAVQKIRLQLAQKSREYFKTVRGPFSFMLFKLKMLILMAQHEKTRGMARVVFLLIPVPVKRVIFWMNARLKKNK